MNCCKHKYFVIYRGDDTDFPGNQELIVELNTERDLTGCSAHFSFQGFTQDFTEIPSDKKLRLVIPNSATGKFALGAADAKLWLTNGTKVRTVESRIHIVVTNRVDEAYDNDDPQAITVTISGGGGGATVVLDDTVTEASANGVKSSGIWSWVKSLLPQWLTASYAEPATVESVNGKQNKITASGILKGNGQGGVTAATKSSTSADPANADYRDPQDNTCHKTEFGEWSYGGLDMSLGTYSLEYAILIPPNIYGFCLYLNGDNIGTTSLEHTTPEDSESISGDGQIGDDLISWTATRSAVCTDGKKYVTSDVVDGKVSSAVSTNNPAFVSAVRNTPTENMPEDMPTDWGTYGTVGAALAALAAFIKWAKAKIVAVIGNDGKPTDQFATDLLGKPVANIKANSSAFAPEYDATSGYAVDKFVWYDGNIYQCKTAIAEGGEAWNAEHWELRKLDDFFTESNSLLTGTIAANSARLAFDEDGEIIVTMNTED